MSGKRTLYAGELLPRDDWENQIKSLYCGLGI